MARHYPPRAEDANNRGLHYSGFSPKSPIRVEEKQLLARLESRKIGKIKGESAKMG